MEPRSVSAAVVERLIPSVSAVDDRVYNSARVSRHPHGRGGWILLVGSPLELMRPAYAHAASPSTVITLERPYDA
jgi:hypothetical protein